MTQDSEPCDVFVFAERKLLFPRFSLVLMLKVDDFGYGASQCEIILGLSPDSYRSSKLLSGGIFLSAEAR
jgi:hypothetical protein